MSTNFQFNVEVFGNFEKISPVLSKAKVRIFYTGLNRNFTYITEEFAEKLLKTLPYTPIVGKYENGDFCGHAGATQVYGVVPENPTITWEKNMDEDGVERTYACSDVLIWTEKVPEAKSIIGKPQSMELYPPSVKGQWIYEDGKKYYKFTDGCFLGLTALGDNVEPCFEGATFYEYSESLKELIKELKTYNLKGGAEQMSYEFKLSDDEKRNAIFLLINPLLETEGRIDYCICDVYDDYALCYEYDTNSYKRFYYTKNDETNSVVIDHSENAYILEVNETEYNLIEKMRSTFGNFETINNTLEDNKNKLTAINNEKEQIQVNYESATQSITQLNEKIESQVNQIDELTNNFTKINQQFEVAQDKINSLEEEKQSLLNYKLEIENKQKESLLSKYSQIVPENILKDFKEKLNQFSYNDLEKELAVKAIDNNQATLFSKVEVVPSGDFTSDKHNYSGAQQLINKYKS